MSDIYIQGETLHVDNKVDRVKIEGINETFESLKPKILRVGEGGGGASALNDLTDVEVLSPQDKQVLKFNSETNKWENANEDTNNLNDLGDVDISTPTSGQILKYDEQNNKWINGDGFLAPAIYSTDEREVGVWTDGKPLYQKTIITTNTTVNSWQNIDISSLNIDSIASMNGYWIRHSSIDTYLTYPFFALEHDYNTYTGLFRIDPGEGGPDNSNLHYKITSDGTSKQVFTLQYTKTTDVAGSGTWTPSGIPAVHYDGNEKVIGTWFGETLYEKTIDCGQMGLDTTITYAHNISNISRIVELKGVVYNSAQPSAANILPVINGGTDYIRFRADAVNVYFKCQDNWTAYNALATLRYTKTT